MATVGHWQRKLSPIIETGVLCEAHGKRGATCPLALAWIILKTGLRPEKNANSTRKKRPNSTHVMRTDEIETYERQSIIMCERRDYRMKQT